MMQLGHPGLTCPLRLGQRPCMLPGNCQVPQTKQQKSVSWSLARTLAVLEVQVGIRTVPVSRTIIRTPYPYRFQHKHGGLWLPHCTPLLTSSSSPPTSSHLSAFLKHPLTMPFPGPPLALHHPQVQLASLLAVLLATACYPQSENVQ